MDVKAGTRHLPKVWSTSFTGHVRDHSGALEASRSSRATRSREPKYT
jgi:hypothetical protein